ncbi:MAG: 2-isopropylmalate synthase [Thaumarchaeota archaeon]|nr:2-isopropylmalate synthase [Nitrososphaerota archaeon]
MNIKIFDTTLRDGEQTPGVALSPMQKLNIAKKLDSLGVNIIEAGFPIISKGELHAIKMITKANLTSEICGLVRTNKKDVDAAIDANLNYIHMFIATSDIHLKYKLKLTREQVIEKAIKSIEYGKSYGLKIEFSAEDATRTERNFLKKVFKEVAGAGADTIDIPDTVGYATPQYIGEITKDAIDVTRLPVSIHCHDDFGLSVANTISAIQNGAKCAHVTINGIGERAGNTPLEELVMALKCLQFKKKMGTNIKTKLLYETSKYISELAKIPVQPNKAIIGDNAFSHESGIHTHGILNNPLTYEPIGPELVGRNRGLTVGKHAGIHGVKFMLEEYNMSPDIKQTRTILDKIKSICDQGKQITDTELFEIANETIKQYKENKLVKLVGFSVSIGIGTMPYAFVKLNINGKNFLGTDYGVGPVDAALNAIRKITGRISQLRIKEYKLASISGGSNALCEVTIKIEDDDNNNISSKYIGKDIVTTSVKAMIDGINKIMLKTNKTRRKKIV